MKYLKILLLSIMLLMIPNIVNADAAAPGFTEFNVRVKNVDGTTSIDIIYENDKQIIKDKKHYNYDDVIKGILYQEKINGTLYVSNGDELIKADDVEAFGKIDLNKFKNNEPGKLYVFKEGAYLYKGPSKLYGKVDNEVMIPVGKTIEYKYSDQLFAYVTYNGVSGWVYIYQDGYGHPYEEETSFATIKSGNLYTIDETKIYTLPKGGDKLDTSIPKNTTVKYKYIYNMTGYSYAYYIEYNNISGWIIDDVGVIEKDKTIFTHLTSVNICNKIEEEGCSKVVGKIPANKIVPIKYRIHKFDDWYYVSYNNTEGYVYIDRYEGNIEVSYSTTYTLKKDAKLYTDIYKIETDKDIKAGVIKVDYVVYDNGNYDNDIEWLHTSEGWIKVKSSDVMAGNDDGIDIDEPTPSDSDNPDIEESTPPDDDVIEPPILNNDDNISFNDIVIYSVIGAVSLSLTIVVIIKLVNKKKEEDTKDKQ